MHTAILLDLPTGIATPRLHLRPPNYGDGAALCAAVAESIVELRQFLGALPWVAADPAPALSEAFARKGMASFLAREDFPLLMFDRADGSLVGACGLHRVNWAVPKIEIGYWCRSSRAGQGLVAEAVRAVSAYAFAHLGMARLELVCDVANTGSRRVAERCGYVLEGIHRQAQRGPDGALRDLCMYARLAGDQR